MTNERAELERLAELSEKGLVAIAIAEGTGETSFERASAFASESHFREELAKWFRASLPTLREKLK